MLTFDKSFFEDEMRCGFLVDSTMKTCWAAEMELLYDIDVICEKHDIPYYVYFGTMLGAVRHQGFVPWDDDIDIALLREDYERLMTVLKEELPLEYVVNNPEEDENGREYWGSVANSDYISIEPDRLQKFHGCPFMVGIDIYPLDFIPRNMVQRENKKQQFHLAYTTCRLAKKEDRTAKDEENLQILLKEIERRFDVRFDMNKPVPGQLVRLQHHIASSVKETEGDELAVYINFGGPDREYPNKSGFARIDWMPFENIYVPVPCGYDEILTSLYGDYKTPVRGRQSHNYPFYLRQLEFLRELSEKK